MSNSELIYMLNCDYVDEQGLLYEAGELVNSSVVSARFSEQGKTVLTDVTELGEFSLAYEQRLAAWMKNENKANSDNRT